VGVGWEISGEEVKVPEDWYGGLRGMVGE